jgi:Effector-associated domain 11
MNLEEIKNTLENAIVEDLDRSFDYFLKVLPAASPKREQLLLLKGQYSDWKKRETEGVITREEAGVGVTRTRKALLEMTAGLTEGDFAEKQEQAPPIAAAVPKFTVIYDLADQPHCTKLNRHLNLLHKILKKIRVYNVHEIGEGNPVEAAVENLKDTDYILVLITANLFNSLDWFEMVYQAIGERRRVIPILVSKYEIDDDTGLNKLRSLPTMGRWVSDFASEDEAYSDIVSSLKKLLKN